MQPRSGQRHSPSGITLVELMVMSVIASLVALTVVQGFSGISKGVIATRFKTMGTQLASEKMQSIKSTPYYRLRVSSQTVTPPAVSSLTPPVLSDETNFPSTTVTVNGTFFTIFANVQRVQKDVVSENLVAVPWNATETGMKKVTVDVTWRERNGLRRAQLTNVLENPNRLTADGFFFGQVMAGATPVGGARVDTLEDPSLRCLADAQGYYRLDAPIGTYSLRAQARGYFPETLTNRSLTNSAAQTNVNFSGLVALSSGSVTGSVWRNNHLVISRVCALNYGPGGTNGEYVEIFNPTTWTWTVDGSIGLSFQRTAVQDPQAIPIKMDYVTGGTDIAPGGFYLFANRKDITINGSAMIADAAWDRTVGGAPCSIAAVVNDDCFPYFNAVDFVYDIMPTYSGEAPAEGAGSISLIYNAGGGVIDRVGWASSNGSKTPATFEGSPVLTPTVDGLLVDQTLYRKSVPSGGISTTLGPAYDSNDNSVDFGIDPGVPQTSIRTTASGGNMQVVSGTPWANAWVWANDGFSQVVLSALSGSPPEARFVLPNIATGTWTVGVASGSAYASFPLTMTGGLTVSTNVVISSPPVYGLVQGRVQVSAGQYVEGITVTPANAVSDSSGLYRAAISTGLQFLPYNYVLENPNYTQGTAIVSLTAGNLMTNIIPITVFGKIYGYVVTGGTRSPLPGISVNATSSGGSNSGVVVTDEFGRFSFRLNSDTYTLTPTPTSGEASTPASISATVNSSNVNVFVGTFTVASNLGTLTGQVSSGGKPVSTGVLVVASTGTISNPPPTIDITFRGTNPSFYGGMSRTDGTYSLPITPGNYNVAAWYCSGSGATPVTTRKDYANITINANQKTTLDIPW